MTGTTPSLLALGDREVHVWYAVTEEQPESAAERSGGRANPESLARYCDWLSPDETARYERFVFDRDRRQYLMTHALGRSVLSRYAPVRPEEWRFSKGQFGRPEIASPAIDRPLRFNLSRTRGMVVCAVAWDSSLGMRELGVDVENIERPNVGLDLISRYFAPPEIDALGRLPVEEQRRRFFEYWTLKEAYLKARGWGLSAPLDKFWFDFEAGKLPRVAFDASLSDDPDAWQFNQYTPTHKHLIALAVRRGDNRDVAVAIREWDGI